MGVTPEAWSVPNMEERTELCRKVEGDSGKGLYFSKGQIPRMLLLAILSPQQNIFSCIMPKYEKLYFYVLKPLLLDHRHRIWSPLFFFFTDNNTVHH